MLSHILKEIGFSPVWQMTFYLRDTLADLWEPYSGDKDVADYAKVGGLGGPQEY